MTYVLQWVYSSYHFTAAPSSLETTFSITITGSSVDVCVETKTARAFKVVLRDAARGRHRQVGEGKHKLFVAVFQISTISSCTYYLIMVVVMVVFMHCIGVFLTVGSHTYLCYKIIFAVYCTIRHYYTC